jgi:hypothetical protein
MKKIGAAIQCHKSGRKTFGEVEPGSIAAGMGAALDDEIIRIGRKLAKWIRPDEDGGIDWRRGQTVHVLRNGVIVKLVIPKRERPSNKYKIIASEIAAANADQLHGLAQRTWGCDDLSDGEKQKLSVAIDCRRKSIRRVQERELPLGKNPAVGVGPPGNYHRDKEHWRRQIAADPNLSPRARQVCNIVEAHYISDKAGDRYFCAWPSNRKLRTAVKCASAKIVEAIHEIEEHGHWNTRSQGHRKPRLMGLVLRRSERAPLIVEAAATGSPTVALPAAVSQPPAVDENCADDFTPAELDAFARGAAILLRPSPHSIANGTAHWRRRAQTKPTRAELDAKRIAESKWLEAAEAQKAAIDRLWANQARGPLFQAEYDPLGYGQR